MALDWVDNGACYAGSREQRAGEVAAARVMMNNVFDACCREHWLIFGYAASNCSGYVSACARSFLVQADAAARTRGLPGIVDAAQRGDLELVRDYLVADDSCAGSRGKM